MREQLIFFFSIGLMVLGALMVPSSLRGGLQVSSFFMGSMLVLISVWLSYVAYVQGWAKHCIRWFEMQGKNPGRLLLIPWWLVVGVGLSHLLASLYSFYADLATPAIQGLLFHVYCVGVSGTLIWLGVKIRAIQHNHRTKKKKAA